MDIAGIKTRYLKEFQLTATRLNAEQIAQSIQANFSKDLYEPEDKKSAIHSVVDKIIVSRIDDTLGRGSKPNLNVQIKFI
ncbi:hypothetical protein SDC9_196462 [bioreactor metagenome]|uniref:Uncharacterized protein n=1 Tax=bioreactor metagenome TaxID=1076179 RepID=A0A645ICJ8_9ZZZZ